MANDEANSNNHDKRLVDEFPNLDRISNLPGNVVDDILVRMSVRDAVKTSVLSKKWRQRWQTIPQLSFDNTFLVDAQQRQTSTSNELLMKIVYEVVLLHSGPLRKFTLSIPGLGSCPEIDRLICFLSRKDIEYFQLFILSGNVFHKLPSHFFSLSQLGGLKLHRCSFRPPSSFKGFNSLIKLEFSAVHFAPDFFENFIPNCPLLEVLRLCRCSQVNCLEINAPNLKFLSFIGSYKFLHLKNAPLLAVLYIRNSYGKDKRTGKGTIPLSVLPSSLPAIELLFIDDYILKVIDVQDGWTKLPTSLSHLKVLTLFFLCLSEVEDLSGLLCLIGNAPHLQKLDIELSQTYASDTNPSVQLLEAIEHSDFSLNQLLKVKLKCFNGTGPEVELVKFLLAKSPPLENIDIEPLSSLDANVLLKVLKEMIGFQRASAKAKILYE